MLPASVVHAYSGLKLKVSSRNAYRSSARTRGAECRQLGAQQFVAAIDGMVGDALKDVLQVRLGEGSPVKYTVLR